MDDGQGLDIQVVNRPAATGNRVRWVLCGLLFFATTTNYLDRQVLGLLAPLLEKELHWTEESYGNMVAAFMFAYALAYLLSGRIVDRFGTRKGYAIFVGIWSLSSAAHAMVSSVFGFGVARFFLGVGESGNFPAALKAVAEWFPKEERAFATGIFNSGTNFAALLAPVSNSNHRNPIRLEICISVYSGPKYAVADFVAMFSLQQATPGRAAVNRE